MEKETENKFWKKPRKILQKKMQIRKECILYGMIAGLIFAAAYGFFFPVRESRKNLTPRVVVLGDSIFGQVRDETSASAYLSKLLGTEVFNGAMGGTCLSRVEFERRMGYTKDCLSFAGLSKAVAAGDFGPQQAARIRQSATEYFPEVIDGLDSIDFSSVEILIVQYGLNDYHALSPLENEDDPYDEYTFAGALRSALSRLKKSYPDMRIVLLTSTYSWYTAEDLTCEEKEFGYGVLEDYVNKELQVAEEMEVECLDLYHNFYPHETWEDWSLYTWDGMHPNEEGRKLLAETVARYLTGEPSEAFH